MQIFSSDNKKTIARRHTSLHHPEVGEEAAVGGGFLVEGEGIGSGGGWHTVESHRAVLEDEL